MEAVTDFLVQNLLVPVVLALSCYLLTVLKSYGKRVSASIMEKNEIESLSAVQEIKKSALSHLDLIIEAVVSGLMSEVEMMKFGNGNGKLTDQQIRQIQSKAIGAVYDCLCPQMTQDDGNLNKILGGTASCNSIIREFIEKHVNDYKNNKRR